MKTSADFEIITIATKTALYLKTLTPLKETISKHASNKTEKKAK